MPRPDGSSPRVGVLVVAYNAAATLASVLDRIPPAYRSRIDRVLVADDASTDSTFLVGVGYRETVADLPITVIRHDENLGYGGNQKWGYRWAMEHGLDAVVLLHADGQYAPELVPDIVRPVLRGDADAVMGSRMLPPRSALRGGMPRYKWVGNRILTAIQNRLTGADLSEWHSGYRAYRVDALRELPLDQLSDGFDFDTQILLELLSHQGRITEIPIPTYYGDEISYVNGLRYARQVLAHTAGHRLGRIGFGRADPPVGYEVKTGTDTSHRQVLDAVGDGVGRGRALDLGCAGGHLGAALRSRGYEVTGVDATGEPGVADHLDRFVAGDLDRGLPDGVEGDFDVVLVADVLEHLRRPEQLLREVRSRLRPGGRVVGSVPNFAHWYPRLRVVTGRFDYDARGILDRGHLRFYTRRTFQRLCREAGYRVTGWRTVGLPVEIFRRGASRRATGKVLPAIGALDQLGVRALPTLFGYQFVFVLERDEIGRRSTGTDRVRCGAAPRGQPPESAATRRQSEPSSEDSSTIGVDGS